MHTRMPMWWSVWGTDFCHKCIEIGFLLLQSLALYSRVGSVACDLSVFVSHPAVVSSAGETGLGHHKLFTGF